LINLNYYFCQNPWHLQLLICWQFFLYEYVKVLLLILQNFNLYTLYAFGEQLLIQIFLTGYHWRDGLQVRLKDRSSDRQRRISLQKLIAFSSNDIEFSILIKWTWILVWKYILLFVDVILKRCFLTNISVKFEYKKNFVLS